MATSELKHLGFIADGNRRWAREHHLPTLEGHRKGAENLENIIDFYRDTEVEYLTFYIFSTENWNRSPEEVSYLMDLMSSQILKLTKKAQKYNSRIVIMGRPERVEPKIWQQLKTAEQSTKHNTGLTVAFCFNYGGQWEIVDAAKRMHDASDNLFTPENFQQYLYHPEIPALDLVVRTSGEERISGFMLWRASYAEFLFIKKYFPELDQSDLASILDIFYHRQRRFGQ